jgi:hypothetical protein
MSKKAAPGKAKKKAPKRKASTSEKTAAPQKRKTVKKVSKLSPKELDNFYRFLCADLVHWLVNPTQLSAGHNLTEIDVLAESYGLQRPSVLDLKERYIDTGKAKLGKTFEYSTDKSTLVKGVKPFRYKLVLKQAIPSRVFRVGDFKGDDFTKSSYGHFYVLKLMLEIVEKRFQDFVYALNEGMQHRNASMNKDADPLSRSATNLKELLSLLKKSHDGYTGISLPDLFSVNINSALLTHDLNYFRSQETDNKKFSQLFTYMYSRETSQSFCAALIEILDKKMENLGTELNALQSSGLNALSGLSLDKWLAAMPNTNTKERMKIALQILDVRNQKSKNEKKVSWTVGDLIFIYRALEQCAAIIPGLKKNRIAIALEMLTGKSHLKYLNNYVSAKQKQVDFAKSFEIKADAPSRESIHRLVAQIKTALDNLLQDIKK